MASHGVCFGGPSPEHAIAILTGLPAGLELDRAAIDADRLLPDMMSYNPSSPDGYPNGRTFTDHVVAHRLAFISKGEIPADGLAPHTDTLKEFPYLGTPHSKKSK